MKVQFQVRVQFSVKVHLLEATAPQKGNRLFERSFAHWWEYNTGLRESAFGSPKRVCSHVCELKTCRIGKARLQPRVAGIQFINNNASSIIFLPCNFEIESATQNVATFTTQLQHLASALRGTRTSPELSSQVALPLFERTRNNATSHPEEGPRRLESRTQRTSAQTQSQRTSSEVRRT